jgi:transcriptional regulator with XRE-family HTH domain
MGLTAKGSGVRGSDDLADRFGAILRVHRTSRGLTQEELASLSGLSVRAIADMERGRTSRPYPNSVQCLAAALGLSMPERQQLERAGRSAGPDIGRTPAPGAPLVLQAAGGTGADTLTAPSPILAEPHSLSPVDELTVLAHALVAIAGTGWTITLSLGAEGSAQPALALHWSPRASDTSSGDQPYVSVRGMSPAAGQATPAEAIRAVLGAMLGSASPGLPENADAADGR